MKVYFLKNITLIRFNEKWVDGCRCSRAYGSGSQCRPNKMHIWIWETQGGVGIHGSGEGTGELVYEQPGNEVDGSCHKRRVPSK